MKVDFSKAADKGFVLLTNNSGSTMAVSVMEFWEICRVGSKIDTKGEVEEYLAQCPDIDGHDLDRIRAFPALVDAITERVIDDRIGEETGDQIYYAAEKCIKSHIAEIENKVKWFRLSDNKCISVWYAPDKYDGDQFQMHLEEIGEDGKMGAGCEILSDESYATNDISFEALCETLNEILEDAEIFDDEYPWLNTSNTAAMIAQQIFDEFGMDKNFVKESKNININNNLKVPTPLGDIVVTVKTDSTYPGVYVDLKGENVNDSFEVNTAALATIEFEPVKNKIQSVVYGDAKSEEPSHVVEHENVEKHIDNTVKTTPWQEYSLTREKCDYWVEKMVSTIRGIGIDEGSGYYGLKSFELYGEKLNLYCEVSREQTDGNVYFSVYYAVEFDEGDTLFSDWEHTEVDDIDELKKVVFEIASADYSKDVQYHITLNDLGLNVETKKVLENARIKTLADITNIGKAGLWNIQGFDGNCYSNLCLAMVKCGVELPDGYEKTQEIIDKIDESKLTPNSVVTIDIDNKALGETIWVNPEYPDAKELCEPCVCVDVIYNNDASLPVCDVENLFEELDFWGISRVNAVTLANTISEKYGIPVENHLKNENLLENVIADAHDRATTSGDKEHGKETVEFDK